MCLCVSISLNKWNDINIIYNCTFSIYGNIVSWFTLYFWDKIYNEYLKSNEDVRLTKITIISDLEDDF